MTVLIKPMVATHHLPEESLPWMIEARKVFGELDVFIDANRVTPGTDARAKSVATGVHYSKVESWYDADWGGMAAACGSDWVLVLDYDEQISPDWHHDTWRRLLQTTDCTHFWVPRRWVVPGGRYVASAPLWPDLQLRVIRNGVPGTAFPSKLHDLIHVPGLGGLLQHLGLYHHNLTLWSRAAREEKVRQYEALRSGGGLRRYYLYEDFGYRMAPLPDAVTVDPEREVLHMDPLTPAEIARISLDVRNVPATANVSEAFWLDATVSNATGRALVALPPYAVRLSYHWLDAATREVTVFDGDRSEVFPCVPPNENRDYQMRVEPPDRPGTYVLQTTMVQESVGWFESVGPEIVREFAITVG